MNRTASRAIRAALRGFEPSEEQWLAIAHDPVPLAIIAGAGSGKTAIMAARIVWMVEEGMYRPAQILGLTFTNKAAGELEQRIASAFAEMDPPPSEQPPISTYNSFSDRLIRDYGVRIGIDPEVGLLSKAQSWQLLINELDKLPPFEAVESRSMSTVVGTALGLAEQCANHLIAPERIIEDDRRILEEEDRFENDVVRASRQRIEFARVVRAYVDAKQRASRIDFGDQVTRAVEILERFDEVAQELRERYPAILLDEYQDTNVAQRHMLQMLAPEGHNVTAVGDARQNIFQWRGSTLFNLIDFPIKHFLREGGEAYDYLPLSTNYRSGSKILEVANAIISLVPEGRRPGKPLQAHPENGEGSVSVKLLSDQHTEAAFIADEIVSLHEQGMTWNEAAILVRRKAHIPAIYQALNDRDIPVEVVGLSGLLQVPEVMDTVSWLRVLADPGPPGNRWLARILLGPRFRIHYRDLALMARWAAKHNIELSQSRIVEDGGPLVADETQMEPEDVAFSLAEALDHLSEVEGLGGEALARLERLRAEIAGLRPKASGPLLELVQSVAAEAGIWEALDASIRSDAEASRRNLTNFLAVVANFSPVAGEPSLGAFLAYLDAAEDVEETLDLATDVFGDSVKLMTIHQAKGLEFGAVFIPSVAARKNEKDEYVDSFFPDTRSSNPTTSYGSLPPTVREDAEYLPDPWSSDGHGGRKAKKKADFKKELQERAIEDERRLFYVALTRAKQRLYVTAAWWYERQKFPRGPSAFFDEVASVPGVVRLQDAELTSDENPLFQLLAEQGRWPPTSPHSIATTGVFPEGYARALEDLLSGALTEEELYSRLAPDAIEEARRKTAEFSERLEALEKVNPRGDATSIRLPGSLSATQLAGLLEGSLTSKDLARPLPERPSAARRIGTEIHRWIEEQALGLSGMADEEAIDLPAAHVERSSLAALQDGFRSMGFEQRKLAQLDSGDPMAELPFALKVGETAVRGRIDAVYEIKGGGLEIVDFKSGQEFEPPEIDQLLIYAAAITRLGLEIGGPLRLTYVHLATRTTKSREVDSIRVAEGLARLEQFLTASASAAEPSRP